VNKMIEKTLVLIKPDGVQRALVGRIIQRFEDVGLKIVATKMVWVDKEFASKHYFDVGERHGERVLNSLTDYLTEGPVIAMVLQGVSSIALVRKLVGSTYPSEALPGTIRGDLSHISKDYANRNEKRVGNLIHASSSAKDAEYEISLWFGKDEIHEYTVAFESHTI